MAGDPRPKFVTGTDIDFQTRFTKDASGALEAGDAYTWLICGEDGTLINEAGCSMAGDSSAGTPDGFNCVATMPVPDPGLYLAVICADEDGRCVTHNAGSPSEFPGYKGFEVLA